MPGTEAENIATGDDQPNNDQQLVEGVEADQNVASEEQGADNQEGEDNADSMNGGYNNMNYGGGSGDFNQMQMMMAMQNGMNPSAFGGFPMMGMFDALLLTFTPRC